MTHKGEDREDEEEEEGEGGIVVTVVVFVVEEDDVAAAVMVVDGLRDKLAYDRNRQLHRSQVVSCWSM